jgi:hypothetical protein
MSERIVVFSFNLEEDSVAVHEFQGEVFLMQGGERIPCINYRGMTEEEIHGMPVQKFLDMFLTYGFRANWNKHVAVARLNTWYWAAIIGDNGGMRGRPRLFRHIMPDGGTPFWVLKKTRGRGYAIVPLRKFSCRFCGEEFERYSYQVEHDVCSTCVELKEEFISLAYELDELGEDAATPRIVEIRQRMAEIDEKLGWHE